MKCIRKIHLVTFFYIFLLVDCFQMSSRWLHWKSKEFTLCSTSFKCKIHLVTFLDIFLLVDCFKWGLIDRKIHLVTFLYILLLVDYFKWALIDHKIHLVTFLYIFLLVDCFKWALIDRKIHLVTFLYILLLVDYFKWALIDHKIPPGDISLYLAISWLFQMSSHWPHWKVKSSLWALPVSNGGLYHKIHLVTFLDIFLLVDCFKWGIIDHIEKRRVHSVLWQFQM